MASDWPMVSIGEVAEVFDGPHATPKTVEHGPIFLGIGALQNGRIQLGETRHVTPDDFKTWTRRVKPEGGDVVFSYETRLGEAAIIPDGFECCLGRRMALVRADRTRLEPRYFLYQFLSPYFQELIRSRTIPGATVDRIALKEFPSFVIPLPPLDEQRAIAETLGVLDDRIDNLRETNTTLRAIATTLFKSRFVDFDGVLPEDMQESELGSIPKGWRALTFGEIAILGKGSVTPAAQPQTVFRHYSLPAFDAGQMPIAEAGEAIKSNKTPVPSNAVLVSKLNPHIPRIWFVGKAGENAVCSTEFLVWTPRPGIGSSFVYFVATSSEFNATMRQLVTGTSNSHQRVKPDQFASAHAAIASMESIAAFDEAAAPLLQKIEHNREQVATLSRLRDVLLPQLISGQLRVKQ